MLRSRPRRTLAVLLLTMLVWGAPMLTLLGRAADCCCPAPFASHCDASLDVADMGCCSLAAGSTVPSGETIPTALGSAASLGISLEWMVAEGVVGSAGTLARFELVTECARAPSRISLYQAHQALLI
jgi:hypothetical protein